MSTDSGGDEPNSPPPDGPSGSRPAPRTRRRRAADWLRRHSRHVLVVAIASAAVGAAVPVVTGEAMASLFGDPPPKCPGTGCTGKNPMKEGCAADVLTWEPEKDNPVRLRIRYSEHCGAVWGQILGGEKGDTVTVRAEGIQQTALINFGSDQFTHMAAVDGTFRARVCAVPTQVGSRTGTWDRYCLTATNGTHWKR